METSDLSNNSSFSESTATNLPFSFDATESSFDNYLTKIVSAVIQEDSYTCGKCLDGTPAFSKCTDCNTVLCNSCIQAHQNNSLTRYHRISRCSSTMTSLFNRNTDSVGTCSQVSLSPGNSSNFCDMSHEPQRFSNSCIVPSYTENLGEPCNNLGYIENAIESAKKTNQKLTDETATAMRTITNAINNVIRISKNVESKSVHIVQQIGDMVQRYVSAIEEREVELIKHIDHTRHFKGRELMKQVDNLRLAFDRLARTANLLSDYANSTNAYDLIMANEQAANELNHIRSLNPELVPCESDDIIFMPPPYSFERAVSAIGCLTIRNSETRFSRNVFSGPQFLANVSRIIKGETLRNCSIYGVNPITVKNTGPIPSLVFGSEGENDGQLCRPWGVCCDHLGHIIVADRSNNRIQIFNGNGMFVHKFGSQGTGPGQFDRPAGVATNPQGHILVADKDNHRIQIFKIDGTFILTFGEKGSRNGQFNYPWDLACNSIGNIVVSDTRNHRIQLFTKDGRFLSKYGFDAYSPMWKYFDSPRGVCFTPKGNVIVTDFNNHRLVVVDQNFYQAQFLGQEGSNCKQFSRPQGVVCDDEGNIIVADSKNNRIQIFEPNGNFLRYFGKLGQNPGELDKPSGICLNPEGRIVVVDFVNNRIQVF